MSTDSLPPWLSLGSGLHLRSLNHDYVPTGLLELTPRPPGLVLDVGCFCGAVGAWLKQKYPQARVVGIEPLEEAARIARGRLDAVLVGKFEDVSLSAAGVEPGEVDLIVLADVLEHMYDPWHALTTLRPMLRPDGVVLASIPNIRNLAVLDQLAEGDFHYTEAGLLDVTHIRFFTRRGVERLFDETGYRIDIMTSNLDPRYRQMADASVVPANIDTPSFQLKNQNREQLVELATLQFWLRAAAAVPPADEPD
jgi:2-polyprenyl-3-methyl-5-hydroxy-6-metoxy-1,4-benzoquinol methylase